LSALDRAWPVLLAARDARGQPPAAPREMRGVERRLWMSYIEFLARGQRGTTVLAHLGASLDGRIATASGHSTWVTGHADLVHMHRLRALADAVIVGAGTAVADDPQLTVRHVDGRSPVRVVLDPRGSLPTGLRIFRDTPPATLWLRPDPFDAPMGVEVVQLPARHGGFNPRNVLDALTARGLRRIMIEGGGQTVSAFLAAGLVDLLHYCVAPVLIGSGRPAFTLPVIATMDEATRLHPAVIPLGQDRLFVCRLATRPPVKRAAAREGPRARRASTTAPR
jgi:riboflavin-specific deaminase-like protein